MTIQKKQYIFTQPSYTPCILSIAKQTILASCFYTQNAYARLQPSLDYLHRRRKEIMAQLEERKVVSPPPFASSPNLPHSYDPSYPQDVRGQNHVSSLVFC